MASDKQFGIGRNRDVRTLSEVLKLMRALGYSLIRQAAESCRMGGRRDVVLLEDVLARQLAYLNRLPDQQTPFGARDEGVEKAIDLLVSTACSEGEAGASNLYDLMVWGESVSVRRRGQSLSPQFRFLDWQRAENNLFHLGLNVLPVEAGVPIMSDDLVGFVNGIPLVLIECSRRPGDLRQLVEQMDRRQSNRSLRSFFRMCQILVAISGEQACYGTVDGASPRWTCWRESEENAQWLKEIVNRVEPLEGMLMTEVPEVSEPANASDDRLISVDWPRLPSQGDEHVVGLCRPERLVTMIRRFVYRRSDGDGSRIASAHEYFTAQATIGQLTSNRSGKPTGKHVSMVPGSSLAWGLFWVVQALLSEGLAAEGRILVLTDDRGLERRIAKESAALGRSVTRARSGPHLAALSNSGDQSLVIASPNHYRLALRSSAGSDSFAGMLILAEDTSLDGEGDQVLRWLLKRSRGAFYLFSHRPASALRRAFQGCLDVIVTPPYSLREAVQDRLVVPCFHEPRLRGAQKDSAEGFAVLLGGWLAGISPERRQAVERQVCKGGWRSRSCTPFELLAWDISIDWSTRWSDTGFRALVWLESEADVFQFKAALDAIGLVRSEVLVRFGLRAGGKLQDTAEVSVVRGRRELVARYGSVMNYREAIEGGPVGKGGKQVLLLNDSRYAPRGNPWCRHLYLVGRFQGSALHRALAWINQGPEMKSFGLVVDYGNSDFQVEQLDDRGGGGGGGARQEAVPNLASELSQLPGLRSAVWSALGVTSDEFSDDDVACQLADPDGRGRFEKALCAYEGVLKVAKASYCWLKEFSEVQRRQFVRDHRRFVIWRDRVVDVSHQEGSVDGGRPTDGTVVDPYGWTGLEAGLGHLLKGLIRPGMSGRAMSPSMVLAEGEGERWSPQEGANTETRFIRDLVVKLQTVFQPYQSFQWVGNVDLENRLRNEIDDCLWDLQETYRVKLSLVEMDDVVEAVIGLARRVSERRDECDDLSGP